MEISPMKAALMHADRRTNIKQTGVAATIPERIKIYWYSRGERLHKKNISVSLNQWGEAVKSVLLPTTSSP
jgi:hypothetical protein